MPLERYVYTGTKRLRCGFTTGSCAAMAAAAATELLLTGEAPARERLVTPSGVAVDADVVFPRVEEGGRAASCGVRKDAGDDVDVTDGIEVRSRVELVPTPPGAAPSVAVDGGEGVGRVTKPGLEQPVGAAAINSVPRAMVAERVRAVLDAHGRSGASARVTVTVPEGAAVAGKTFNPHLGVMGGISILGTTGIVEPRSLRALRESVELEIRQKAALGHRDLLIVPGNYGREFAAGMPTLSGLPEVECSNFIGAALDEAARGGFANVLVVGHIGKLVKVAGGIMDTHSRVADARVEIVCAHAALSGASRETAARVMAAATTDACLDILEEDGGPDLLRATMASLTAALGERLERRVAGSYRVGAILFSKQRGELGRTADVDDMIEAFARDGDRDGEGVARGKGDEDHG